VRRLLGGVYLLAKATMSALRIEVHKNLDNVS
jgi:hypothetical protein